MHRVVLVVAVCAVALAACGSSPKPGASASSAYAKAVKAADCMRAHGVPNFPDPSPNGPNEVQINPAPAFQAAMKACAILAPGATGFPPPTERHKILAIAFAKCMRAHGLPGFPDPTTTPPAPGHGDVIGRGGMFFVLGTTVNPGSPAFEQPARACGLRVP
jgi:hypothetical protein